MDEGEHTVSFLLDLSKTLDTLNRSVLLEKLNIKLQLLFIMTSIFIMTPKISFPLYNLSCKQQTRTLANYNKCYTSLLIVPCYDEIKKYMLEN